MKTLKTILILSLIVSMTPMAMSGPRRGHRPPPPPPHRHHHHHCNWWIPTTIFTTAVVAGAAASASTKTETIVVEKPATTTVIYQNAPVEQKQKISREEIRPDGTRVIYYEYPCRYECYWMGRVFVYRRFP